MTFQMYNETPWRLISVLLLVGAAAASLALWLADHRTAVRDSGALIAILFGTFFVSWSWALIQYLRWRDRRRAVAPAGTTYREDLAGTVYGLVSGAEYRVVQSFRDHYSNQFERGEILRFKERHFLPYHGGHTIVFDTRSLYLQESENEELLANFSNYIERVERPGEDGPEN